jgi:8-oxo-dGTP pyrophosphatase MutT (NUDIX family)
MTPQERELAELLESFEKTLPKKKVNGKLVFDYSQSPIIAFILCIAVYEDTILLLQRSDKVATNKNKWNVIAGYYDEYVPAQEKVLEELEEEAGIEEDAISHMHFEQIIEVDVDGIRWIVLPAVIQLRELPVIALNWENNDVAWATIDDLKNYDIVEGVADLLRNILK